MSLYEAYGRGYSTTGNLRGVNLVLEVQGLVLRIMYSSRKSFVVGNGTLALRSQLRKENWIGALLSRNNAVCVQDEDEGLEIVLSPPGAFCKFCCQSKQR